MMVGQSIISLAILKVNWDIQRKDYLENFVPIVGEAIRVSDHEEVSVPLLQTQLKELFGLQVPQNAIKAILRRLQKRGYIKVENKIYRRNLDALSKLDFHATQQQALKMHESLITHLQHFAEEYFQISLKEAEAENAFHEYIQENQIAVTNYSENREPLLPEPEVRIKGGKYIVGAFIKHLEESHSPDFEYLETVVKGNFMANAIFITDPSNTSKKFRKTEVYFDTSFLIFALGHAGQARQDPCKELLELLYRDGANLRCFQHTLEEVRGVLDACTNIIRQGRLKDAYGPSIEYFIANRFTASDIEVFRINLERDLGNLRIEVVEKPAYIPEYVIDEAKLLDTLTSNIQYHNPFAPQRDVDSISAIMRLRRGNSYFFVEECRAIFVTTNNSLVRFSRDFFYSEAPSGSIPPCIPDYLMTNLLWLKTPLNAPDLPRKRIIADYYAATQPSNYAWKSYLSEIDQLQTNGHLSTDDYYLLRYALEAKTAFMDVTLGEEDVFSFGTVNEILALARQRIQQDHEEKFQLKIREEIQKRENAESIAHSAKANELIRKTRITNIANRAGSILVTIIRVVVMAGLLIGTVSTFPWDFPTFSSQPIRYVVAVLQFVVLILSILGQMYGLALETYMKSFEIWLSKKIETSLLRNFG